MYDFIVKVIKNEYSDAWLDKYLVRGETDKCFDLETTISRDDEQLVELYLEASEKDLREELVNTSLETKATILIVTIKDDVDTSHEGIHYQLVEAGSIVEKGSTMNPFEVI